VSVISLLYHDIIDKCDFHSSGRPGSTAARYKIDVDEFQSHLEAIAEAVDGRLASFIDMSSGTEIVSSLVFSFDDGGSSAYDYIAGRLESFGWRGHFLATSDYINKPAFLTASQIRELRERGHVIGSHSCSHPKRMSHCKWDELVEEWDTSVRILSDIIGEQVIVASVPGGYYSKRVAEAASSVGIKTLFTSEPTTRYGYVNGCLVLGRYTVRRGTPTRIVSGLASGRLAPRLAQSLLWNTKKVAKLLGGELYLKIRKSLFSQTTQ